MCRHKGSLCKSLSEHCFFTIIMACAFQTILNIVIDLAVVQARQIVAVVQARQIGESKSSAESGVSKISSGFSATYL